VGGGLWGRLVVWTPGRSAKVRRIRRTPRVAVAVCNGRTGAELAGDGVESRSYTADVTDLGQLRAVLDRITADLGPIDTVYFGPAAPDSAGPLVPLPEADVAAVRAPFDAIVVPAVGLVEAVLPAMLERGAGALLFGAGSAAGSRYR
jgi:NADP-dependent 3-hydroxy acid dehydrogenase YdfG